MLKNTGTPLSFNTNVHMKVLFREAKSDAVRTVEYGGGSVLIWRKIWRSWRSLNQLVKPFSPTVCV